MHNQDALQRVFNVVYGDMLFLAGVLPYNREYVWGKHKVRARSPGVWSVCLECMVNV